MKTDDPRLTAYALGELTGAEREAFEAELALSEDLQRELIALTQLTDMIAQLPPNPEDQLDAEDRRALKTQIRSNLAERQKTRWTRMAVVGTLTAAAACVVLLLNLQETPQAFQGQKIADTRSVPKDSNAPAGPVPEAQTAKSDPALVAAVQKQIKARLEKSEQRLIAEAQSFTQAGRYDLAVKRYEQVLNQDPYNVDARKGVEAINQARSSYAATAYNESRGRMLMSVDRAWERPVIWYNDTPQASVQMQLAEAGSPVMSGRRAVDAMIQPAAPQGGFNTESYDAIQENVFLAAKENPLSTFSIDVDTASYANMRRFLQAGQRPPAGAIRTEELINYFRYDLPQPQGDAPFSVTTDVTRAPWSPRHLLARIALQGRDIERSKLPPSNLVFLVDVSGSMGQPNKLPLLQQTLLELVDELRDRDRVALVTYAGSTSVVLPSTSGENKAAIRSAIERLGAGGSTNGASGIQLAYQTAREQFLAEGNNRVLLCTDGDLNVGITSQSDLVDLIENERKSGVFLSVLGFGTGNYKDSTLEKLADKGNGNYAYIDSLSEGRKVLVEQMGATLFTIAKDVKIQVEFNPATVAGYRLIGYENRLLAKEDFNDDTKDAGEIGAGHTVTALYEIVPVGQELPADRSVDPLKYQSPAPVATAAPVSEDLFTVKLRYKAPDGEVSKLIEKEVGSEVVDFEKAPADARFAAAVAAFGMKLRGSPAAGDLGWEDIRKIARDSLGEDKGSYRAEFLTLIEKARQLPKER